MSDFAERVAVEDLAIRLFVATDRRNWPAVEDCFTDPLILDMTSLAGGEPLTLKPADVSRAWAEGFRSLDHVHHQVGNFQTSITGDRARMHCYGIAFHHRASIATTSRTRVFVGTYDLDCTRDQGRWRIGLLRFHLKFIEGNPELDESAQGPG